MLTILPPGDMTPVTCEKCGGRDFGITLEYRDGQIVVLHSICRACGRRGALLTNASATITREFYQFENSSGIPSFSVSRVDDPLGTDHEK